MTHSDALRALERGGLLRRSAGSDGREYAFHHVLSQEAAYHTLLKADRARLHGDVAWVILALINGSGGDPTTTDAASESAASLVFHYERAGDDPNLCAWAVRAGDGAHRRFASHEALDYYDRALGAAKRMGAAAPREFVRAAFAGKGHILRTTGDPAGALANFQAMQAFGELAGDNGMAIEALNHINTIRIITPDASAGGILGELDEEVARARKLALNHGDPALCARAVWNAGLRVRFTDTERAAGLFGEALAMAKTSADGQRRDLREITATAAADLAVIRAISGEFEQSWAHAAQAVAAARTLDNGALLADALGNLALNALFGGDPQTLVAASDEAIAISTAAGNPWGIAYSHWPRIEYQFDCGAYEHARTRVAETLPTVRTAGMPVFIGFYQAVACRLARLTDDSEGALQAARESEAAFLSMGGDNWTIAGLGIGATGALISGDIAGAGERLARIWSPSRTPSLPLQGYRWALPAFGEHALRTRSTAAALSFLDWYVDVRERHGGHREAAEGRYWRGRVRAAESDDTGAKDDFTQARATFARLGGHDHLWRIDAALSMLARRMGDPLGAADATARAKSNLEVLAGGFADPGSRRALLRKLEDEEDE